MFLRWPICLILACAALEAGCAHTRTVTDLVVGRYEHCVMSCQIIEIRADHAFTIETYPELGDGPSLVRGTWKAVAPNVLVARSEKQADQFPVSHGRENEVHGVQVRARFEDGTPAAGASISLWCNGVERQTVADRDGIALFEECDPSILRVSFVNFAPAIYHLDHLTGNAFDVVCPLEPFFITDDKWFVQDGRLYMLTGSPYTKVRGRADAASLTGATVSRYPEARAGPERDLSDVSTALSKCEGLPGYTRLQERFVIERAIEGYIQLRDESLFVQLRALQGEHLTAAWWLNPLVKGLPQYDWNSFISLYQHVDELLSRHSWLSEWRSAASGRSLELHAFGLGPEAAPEEIRRSVRPIWHEAGFRGEPQYEVLARLGDSSWIQLFLGDEDPRLLAAYSMDMPTQGLHWFDELRVQFHPRCRKGDISARYAVIQPTGEWTLREYAGCRQ